MHPNEMTKKYPLVSVVIEGYNELHDLGTTKDTLDALAKQDYPLNLIEVILVGTSAQVDVWETQFSNTQFYAVKPFAADGINYYELKNICVNVSSGQIFAFTDSDVTPRKEWIKSGVEKIQEGADAVVGPSLFGNDALGADSVLMRVAASIAWGFVIGKDKNTNNLIAANILSHNAIFNADSFRKFQFDANYGRTCSAVLLYKALIKSKRKVALSFSQQTVHSFSWNWWIFQYHRRIGYEVYQLRRLDDYYPNKWISKTKLLEPPLTLIWHVLLDIPRWLRFSKALNESYLRRWSSLPVVVILSVIARSSEMLGMYATLAHPEEMKQWAENA
ncbi:MAG: glycosyltransferase [Xenococcaceae cyanobacterium MO_188.B32]|nr:glycosyltransferase [Xenococcaceae cyanobacterium MO_188.B32]